MKQFGWLLIFLLLLSFMLIDKYCHHPIEDAIVQLNELQVVVDSLRVAEKYNRIHIDWNTERTLLIEAEGYRRYLWGYSFTGRMRKVDHKYLLKLGLLGFYNETK